VLAEASLFGTSLLASSATSSTTRREVHSSESARHMPTLQSLRQPCVAAPLIVVSDEAMKKDEDSRFASEGNGCPQRDAHAALRRAGLAVFENIATPRSVRSGCCPGASTCRATGRCEHPRRSYPLDAHAQTCRESLSASPPGRVAAKILQQHELLGVSCKTCPARVALRAQQVQLQIEYRSRVASLPAGLLRLSNCAAGPAAPQREGLVR